MVWILKQGQTYMNDNNIKHYARDYMLYLPNYLLYGMGIIKYLIMYHVI